MREGVSLDEIEVVQKHVIEALVRSDARSTLSDDEQDRELSQACAEACGILDRWVKGPAWAGLRPASRGPIADVIPDWQAVRPFLGPLSETLSRISERRPTVSGIAPIGDPEAYVEELIKQAESTGRRHRGFSRDELYAEATKRIEALRASVCAAATDFDKVTKNRARRRSITRTVLKHVAGFLLSASLIMVGVTPEAMAHDMPEWGHEAVNVLLVHHAGQAAQPAVRMAPPHLGAELGPQVGPELG
jgi:hypothetical protein